MSAKQYRTPDNKYAGAKVAMKAWEDLYTPICKKYKLRITAFDPALRFEDETTGAMFDMPVWFAKRLLEDL